MRHYAKGRSHLSKAAMSRMGDTFMPQVKSPAETRTEAPGSKTARTQRRRVR